eukprot:gene17063-26176_t
MEAGFLHGVVRKVHSGQYTEEKLDEVVKDAHRKGVASYYFKQTAEHTDGFLHTPLSLAVALGEDACCQILAKQSRHGVEIPLRNPDTGETETVLSLARGSDEISGATVELLVGMQAQLAVLRREAQRYPMPDELFLTKAVDFVSRFRREGASVDTKPPAEIVDGLFLAGAAGMEVLLQSERVPAGIVNCCPRMVDTSGKAVPYLEIDCDDSIDYPIVQHAEQAIAFIEEHSATPGGVYVHCYGGVNRSTALVVCFLLLGRRMRLFAALRAVCTARPIVLTNRGFLRQLVGFAHAHGLLESLDE